MLNTIFKNNEGTVNHAQTASIGHFPPVGIGIAPGQTPQGVLPGSLPIAKQANTACRGIITVQMENGLLAEKNLTVLNETKARYYADSNNEMVRFIFHGNLGTPFYLGKIMCGADVLMGTGYPEAMEGVQMIHSDKEYDLIPYWMYPANDTSPLNSSRTLYGESQWINYIKPIYQMLKKPGVEQDKEAYAIALETANILNKYFRKIPFNEEKMAEFLNIQDLGFNMQDYYEKTDDGQGRGKFMKDAFCEYMIQRYRLINLESLPYRYINGVYYLTNADEVERLLLKYLENSSNLLRKEVRLTIFSMLGVYMQEISLKSDFGFDIKHPAKPELIAFKNGIFNASTGKMSDFGEDTIITNRIPFDLKYEYYNKLVADGRQTEEMKIIDNWLDSFSGENQSKRLVLEEVAGLAMYRRNEGLRRHHTILFGAKESGKSTFIHMIESLIGDTRNCSHVSLKDICNINNRFSLITMVGTLINTYADISGDRIYDTARLKNLCTGDPITVEQKGQPVMSMSYQGKLIFGCNELPHAADSAFSSRFEFIPCTADYSILGNYNIPNLFEDYLSKKECMEYFAYLSIIALQRFINNGFRHTPCAENNKLRQAYEEVSDPVYTFINSVPENEIVNQDTSDVFAAYTTYLREYLDFPESKIESVTKNSLTASLRRFGYITKRKSVNNKKIRVYIKYA